MDLDEWWSFVISVLREDCNESGHMIHSEQMTWYSYGRVRGWTRKRLGAEVKGKTPEWRRSRGATFGGGQPRKFSTRLERLARKA